MPLDIALGRYFDGSLTDEVSLGKVRVPRGERTGQWPLAGLECVTVTLTRRTGVANLGKEWGNVFGSLGGMRSRSKASFSFP